MLYCNIYSWQKASIVNWSILSISHRNSDILKNVNCREKGVDKIYSRNSKQIHAWSSQPFQAPENDCFIEAEPL